MRRLFLECNTFTFVARPQVQDRVCQLSLSLCILVSCYIPYAQFEKQIMEKATLEHIPDHCTLLLVVLPWGETIQTGFHPWLILNR